MWGSSFDDGGHGPAGLRILSPERKDSPMKPTHIFVDLTVPDIEEARDFYVD